MMKRGSGLLLHISSLPSSYGIGDFGPGAYEFVDFLSDAKQMYWQILPLSITEEINGYSPYSSISAFAGNYLFISPDLLLKDGFLTKSDLSNLPVLPEETVDYHRAMSLKNKFCEIAFEKFKSDKKVKKFHAEYEMFCVEHAFWLEDFVLFVVLKERYGNKSWNEWPVEFRDYEVKALEKLKKECADDIYRLKFQQFLFYRQWFLLKEYCEKKNVHIIGDVPIYVNYDSVDVWTNRNFFKLSEDGEPRFVGGVPPDYFSETGQRWGNPLYQWDELKNKGYSWWVQRIKHNLNLFDHIRIDHFRGFAAYWQIDAEEKTAVNGHWMNGPGEDFFNVLKKTFPYLPIIAEDMGVITPDVTALMNQFQFPGMKVLLFAFGDDLQNNPYLPHNHIENCVVYTGTHDNNTILGWYLFDAGQLEKDNLERYFQKKITEKNIGDELVSAVINSKANVSMLPLQDILGLGKEARMNIPSTIQGNWKWRCHAKALSQTLLNYLKQLTEKSSRC